MIEYEEIDGKLQLVKEPCKHEWGYWKSRTYSPSSDSGLYEVRTCFKCLERQVLVPRGTKVTARDLDPGKLPVRSRFSVFLADWKVRYNK